MSLGWAAFAISFSIRIFTPGPNFYIRYISSCPFNFYHFHNRFFASFIGIVLMEATTRSREMTRRSIVTLASFEKFCRQNFPAGILSLKCRIILPNFLILGLRTRTSHFHVPGPYSTAQRVAQCRQSSVF